MSGHPRHRFPRTSRVGRCTPAELERFIEYYCESDHLGTQRDVARALERLQWMHVDMDTRGGRSQLDDDWGWDDDDWDDDGEDW